MALLGDTFLLFEGDQFFLLGLSSFMIMQILYVISFIKDKSPNLIKFLVSFGLLLFLTYYLSLMWDDLNEMAIPVSVYSLIIVLMAVSAIFRNHTLRGYLWVVIGAILFMISDGLIAWTKFMSPIINGGIMIMSTYILAQYLIVAGILKRDSLI